MKARKERISPDSTINKADAEEPVFVLRAQDMSADILVDFWAELALRMGCSQEKVDEAIDLAAEMRAWPNRKWPD